MQQFSWLSEPVVIIIGLILASAMMGLFFWRRRSTGEVSTAASPTSERELGRLVASFADSNPAFSSIMKNFQQRHSLRYLCRHEDVKAAFADLARNEPPAAAKSSLQLTPATPAHSREAAMVTIVRAIYEDDSYYRELPAQTHRELDELLDSLTGGGPEEL